MKIFQDNRITGSFNVPVIFLPMSVTVGNVKFQLEMKEDKDQAHKSP